MKNVKIKSIGYGVCSLFIIASCGVSKNNSTMLARMEVNEPIDGVCDNDNVIAILPFLDNNQVKAKAPKDKKEIEKELNSKVKFLQDKSNYEDKGMVGLIVNCEGELVQCKIDNRTKSPELDQQIVAVFSVLTNWKPGKVNNQPVDSVELYSFTIKNGKITLN